MKLLRIVFLVYGLGITGFAGWFGLVEYRAFLQRNGLADTFSGQVSFTDLRFISTRTIASEQKQMLYCLNGQKDYHNTLSSKDIQDGFARACLDRADGILSTSPSRSLAHLERADALRRLKRNNEAADALAQAQMTGAYENWMAIIRVRIALHIAAGDKPNGFSGDPTAVPPELRNQMLSLASKDMALLVASPKYNDRLAMIYNSTPEFSDWFITVIEEQPASAQRRFLAAVKRVGGS